MNKRVGSSARNASLCIARHLPRCGVRAPQWSLARWFGQLPGAALSATRGTLVTAALIGATILAIPKPALAERPDISRSDPEPTSAATKTTQAPTSALRGLGCC